MQVKAGSMPFNRLSLPLQNEARDPKERRRQ
jgi:hypothetical protein